MNGVPESAFAYTPYEGEEFVKANGDKFVYRGGHLLKSARPTPNHEWVRCYVTEDGLHQWSSTGFCAACNRPLQLVRGEGGSESDFRRQITDLKVQLHRAREDASVSELNRQKYLRNQAEMRVKELEDRLAAEERTRVMLVKENEAKERMLGSRDRIIESLDAEYQTLRSERDGLQRRCAAAYNAVDPSQKAPT